MLASSSKATTISSLVRTAKITATRPSAAEATKVIAILGSEGSKVPVLLNSILGHGPSVVLEAYLIEAHHHPARIVIPILPRDLTVLFILTNANVTTSRTMRKTARGATMIKTTTKTMARVHLAPALMAKEDEATDTMAMVAVAVAVTALEDEMAAVLMMDLAEALAALTTPHLYITTVLIATMADQDAADPGAVAVVVEVAVLLEASSADLNSSAVSISIETLHQCLHPCGRLSLPSTRPTRTMTPLRRITKILSLKPTSSTLPPHSLSTSPSPAQRRKMSE